MGKSFLKFVLICIITLSYNDNSAQSSAWRQHRNDPQNTGYTSSVPPMYPVLERQIELNGKFYAQPVIDSKGNIYAASQNDTLYAFTPELNIIWKNKLGVLDWNAGGTNSYPALSPDESTVYLFDWEDGRLNAFNTSDGSLKWKSEEFIKDYGWGIPTVASNGDIFLVHGDIICILPNGTTRWRLSNNQYHHWAGLSPDEATVYVGSYNRLHCLNAAIGGGDYFEFSTFWAPYPVAIDNEGRLYSGRSSLLRSIATPGGLLNWSFGYIGDAERIAVDNSKGRVYMAYNDTLISVGFNGSIIWKKEITNVFFDNVSGPAIDGNGYIYISNYDQLRERGIIKIDWQTGEEIADMKAVGTTITTHASIANGKIYAGLNNGIAVWGENTVGINDEKTLPEKFYLDQNYPNPFNPSTTIKFSIPKGIETSNGASMQNVTLKVYDILGNEVAALVNEKKEPGVYQIVFDASHLSSGIYFYKLQAGPFVQTKKLILMK